MYANVSNKMVFKMLNKTAKSIISICVYMTAMHMMFTRWLTTLQSGFILMLSGTPLYVSFYMLPIFSAAKIARQEPH